MAPLYFLSPLLVINKLTLPQHPWEIREGSQETGDLLNHLLRHFSSAHYPFCVQMRFKPWSYQPLPGKITFTMWFTLNLLCDLLSIYCVFSVKLWPFLLPFGLFLCCSNPRNSLQLLSFILSPSSLPLAALSPCRVCPNRPDFRNRCFWIYVYITQVLNCRHCVTHMSHPNQQTSLYNILPMESWVTEKLSNVVIQKVGVSIFLISAILLLVCQHQTLSIISTRFSKLKLKSSNTGELWNPCRQLTKHI